MIPRRVPRAPRAVRGALLVLALAFAACRPLAGPEAEIARALERLPSDAPAFAAGPRGTLRLERARFDRLLVKPEGGGFVAIATVDAEAHFEGGGEPVRVSYLGVERIPFERVDGRWRPRGPALPALAEITALLSERLALANAGAGAEVWQTLLARDWKDARLSRDAMLEQLQARGAQPGVHATAWVVRTERDRAEVLEERVGADGAARSRWELRREDGSFRFASGLL